VAAPDESGVCRRRLLRGCLLPAVGAVAGCVDLSGREPPRQLLAGVETAAPVDDGWTLDVVVDTASSKRPGEDVFHDVRLVAYGADRRRVRTTSPL
jgi:hypothetical protein